MSERFWNNQRGMLLAWVLMLMAILSILTVAALTLAASQFAMSSHYSSSVKSLHYAEAGIHHYLAYLNSEDSPNRVAPPLNEDVAFEGGNYRLDLLKDDLSGRVILRSTGWAESSNGEKSDLRTVDVVLKKRSFAEYGYFSNEDDNLWWMWGEKFYGPYHTNGTLHVASSYFFDIFKPKFYGPVTYSKRMTGFGRPVFAQGVSKVDPIPLPETNAVLADYAKNGGLYFQGLTCIRLHDNGQITVRNLDLNNGFPVTMALPANGVIYVDGASASYNDRFARNSGNVFVSGKLKGRLTIASKNDIYITGKDPTKWIAVRPWQLIPDIFWYQTRFNNIADNAKGVEYAGTTFEKVYDKGEMVGYHAVGDDMLGLVAEKDIRILTMGWFVEGGNTSRDSLLWSIVDSNPSGNITIDAALLALNGSFENPAFWLDFKPKKIVLRGSITQSRGGIALQIIPLLFTKDYAHDDRMLYEAPPHFLAPEMTGWEILEWNETREHLSGAES